MLRPLRRNSLITATIASVALTVALENLVRFAFGNSLRDYDLPMARDWRSTDCVSVRRRWKTC